MCCRSRSAERCGDSSLVENISCRRIEPKPQALRGGDLAVFQQRQQRAAAAHVGDQGLLLIDAQGVAHRLAHGGDRQPALLGGVDHLDVQPGGHEDAVEERVALLASRTALVATARTFSTL